MAQLSGKILPPGWRYAVEAGEWPGQVTVSAAGPAGTRVRACCPVTAVGSAALFVAAQCWESPRGFLEIGEGG